MAILDDESKAVVLRVVYAGPPMSGKTATLRALAQHLLGTRAERAVFSPDEAHGRTLFFDWLEYSGGLFQGRKIRSQIVSVPGQGALVERRRLLLSSADAVVFVVDAHAEQRAAIASFFAELREFTARPQDEPPLGVIVQANKMDLPDALSVEALRELLGDGSNMTVVPTVAMEGKGVREAFVQAVGIGLARAKELFDSGRLKSGKADIESGEDLLRRMTALEEARFGHARVLGAQRSVVDRAQRDREELAPGRLSAIVQEAFGRTEAQPAPDRRVECIDGNGATGQLAAGARAGRAVPRLPSRNPNAGSLWPTIAGRIIVHEISDLTVDIEQKADLSWHAQCGEKWQLLCLPQQSFDNEAHARNELLRMARRHAEMKSVLSEHRCIAYNDSGLGDWKVWQIARRDKTLGEALDTALRLPEAEAAATELFRIACLLWAAMRRFREFGLEHVATLRTIAVHLGSPVYTGFVELQELDVDITGGIEAQTQPAARLRGELSAAVRSFAASRAQELPRLLHQLGSLKGQKPELAPVTETLTAMFIGH